MTLCVDQNVQASQLHMLCHQPDLLELELMLNLNDKINIQFIRRDDQSYLLLWLHQKQVEEVEGMEAHDK